MLALRAGTLAAQPAPHEIAFARGASGASVHGGIARGEAAFYRFDAREWQWAVVEVDSIEDNAVVSVYAPGWRLLGGDGDPLAESVPLPPLHPDEDGSARWEGLLPASGSYLIVVGSRRGGAEYDLRLEIRAADDEDCWGLPQQPMNRCTGAVAERLEVERVAAERSVASRLDPDRRKSLDRAEQAWKAYRDAQCELAAAGFEGGSLQPTIYNSCVAAMTRQRLAALHELAAAEDG